MPAAQTAPLFFFFNDTATTEIYTLSLHDALPISVDSGTIIPGASGVSPGSKPRPRTMGIPTTEKYSGETRSEEHTSELQSRLHLVCRLLLEKKTRSRAAEHAEDRPRRRRAPRTFD